MQEREKILKHLSESYTEPVRDPIWQHIYLSRPFLKIINCAVFQKLNHIKQLGLTYLVYPGAMHSRYNHSLGVYYVAKSIITELVLKQKSATFSLGTVKAFLCAALLHDLGHFPFAHSLKELEVVDHEVLTEQLILHNSEIYKIIEEDLQVDPALVSAIVNLKSAYSAPNRAEILFFRNLLSGVLDPDKIDYLNRDAYFCGVPYGIQDFDFILNQLVLDYPRGISMRQKGLSAVESLLFSKYLMYKSVYWHPKTRVLTAMIKKAVYQGITNRIIAPQDLYDLDDQEFLLFTRARAYKPFRLIERAFQNQLYLPLVRLGFQENNDLHRKLEHLPARYEFEEHLRRTISAQTAVPLQAEELIIDIPEAISFEIDLVIAEESSTVLFAQSESVFSPQVIEGFSANLRCISLLIAPEQYEKVKHLKPALLNQLIQSFPAG